MKTLVYRSRVAAKYYSTEEEVVQQIINKSVVNNPKLGITGTMVFHDHHFLQVLEGPEESVDRLFAVISADARHEDIVVLFDEGIASRSFADWAMKAFQVNEGSFDGPAIDFIREIYAKTFKFDAVTFLELLQNGLSDPEILGCSV